MRGICDYAEELVRTSTQHCSKMPKKKEVLQEKESVQERRGEIVKGIG